MIESHKKENVAKIYCEKCDSIFESKTKYQEHYQEHLGISCESCPIDSVMQKIVNLFKKRK